MNKVTLIGNLVRSPELSTTPSGISVCKFSIAVNRSFVKEGGEREVDFFNIIAWRGLADNCGKYLSKGKKVAISGNIQIRNYEDKDGNKRYVTEIIAEDVEFLSPRDGTEGGNNDDNSGSGKQSQPKRDHAELKPVESEDLPF